MFLAACQSTLEGNSIAREQQRPDDGIEAFTSACIKTDATRESARRVFDNFNIFRTVRNSANGTFPGGEFIDQAYAKEVGPRGIEHYLKSRLGEHESYCVVRIRGLWMNDAQQPISNALSEDGFKYVENFAQAQEQDFQISKLSGVYQNRGRYFLLIAAQSAQRAGRITDLEFYELATK